MMTNLAEELNRRFRFEAAVTLRPTLAYKNRKGLEQMTEHYLKVLDKEVYPHGKATLKAVAFIEHDDHVHIGIGGFPIAMSDETMHKKMVKAANLVKKIWHEHHIADSKRFQLLRTGTDSQTWTSYITKAVTTSDALVHYGPVRKQEHSTLDKFFDSPVDNQ